MKRNLPILWLLFFSLGMVIGGCSSLKITGEKTLSPEEESKWMKKNPMSYYQASLPYLHGSNPELGRKRLENLLTYHPLFSPALQALSTYCIQRREYRNALHWLTVLRTEDSVLFSDSYELYAIALAGDGQFIKAAEHMGAFIHSPNANTIEPELLARYQALKRDYDFAVAYGQKLKTFMSVGGLKISNLGPAINSPAFEYAPTMSLNGKRIIFTRRERYKDEDLYEAYKDEHGVYKPATAIQELNTAMNEGSASLSSDNKKLLITYCDMNRVFGKCDLFISYYAENGGWTTPVNLGPKINSVHWESQPQFGPNNNSIYFSSDRPGGFGGKDVFLAKRMTDRQWEKPVNLGFPINTIDKEGGLVVQFNATYGYFSSDKSDGKSQGAMDIYRYELPKEFRPKVSTWVQGKVVDIKTAKEMRASVFITNLTTKRDLGKVLTTRNGDFLLTLPTGDHFSFHIVKNGYLFYSRNLHFSDSNTQTVNETFFLQPIEVGATLTLRNLFFKTDEYTLDEKSTVELNLLVDMLNSNQTMHIRIQGHTDNVGDPAYNQELSLKRARAVERYLINKGIAKFRLSSVGFGDTQPAYNNDTEEGRKNNRRCIIQIIKP